MDAWWSFWCPKLTPFELNHFGIKKTLWNEIFQILYLMTWNGSREESRKRSKTRIKILILRGYQTRIQIWIKKKNFLGVPTGISKKGSSVREVSCEGFIVIMAGTHKQGSKWDIDGDHNVILKMDQEKEPQGYSKHNASQNNSLLTSFSKDNNCVNLLTRNIRITSWPWTLI